TPVIPATPLISALPPAAPGGTFNLLEIGEMVENEDLDGVDLPPVRPSMPPMPPMSSPPPPPIAVSTVSSGRGLDDSGGMSWLDEAEAGRGTRGRGGELVAG